MGGLEFTDIQSGIQFSGCIGKEYIEVVGGNCSERKIKAFSKEVMLSSPGKSLSRLSLRSGRLVFNEGNTISYALN
jgi:hypothetical protein